MDQAHVCLVTMTLRAQAFELFRCDRPLSMGINIGSFAKIMRCAGTEDSVKIVADDSGPDCAEFIFENTGTDRVAHFELKLMDIDQDTTNVFYVDDSSKFIILRLICNLLDLLIRQRARDKTAFNCSIV